MTTVSISETETTVEVAETEIAVQLVDTSTSVVISEGFGDHGMLTGLGDDDHPQYLTTARGDARYQLAGADAAPAWADITSKPTTIAGFGILDAFTQAAADALYSPLGHTHSFASLTSKPTSISGYGITDAFTQAAADALYSPLGHTHSFASLTSKPTTIAGFGITDTLAYTNIDNQFTVGQGFRAAIGSNAAAMYVPWLSGDTATTISAGSSDTSNNQPSFYGESYGATAIIGVAHTAPSLEARRVSVLTNSAATLLNITHRSSGVIATDFAATIRIQLQSSTTADQDAARILSGWSDPAHATRTSYLSFATVNNAGALTERLRIAGAGAVAIRTTNVTTAAGLYVPWLSGDALPAGRFGGSTSGNNQIGVRGDSDSAQGVYGTSTSAAGVFGQSSSYAGVFGQTTSGQGLYGAASASSGVPILAILTAALTNTAGTLAKYSHRTSGTPAIGFGGSFLMQLQSTTTNDQDAATITASWADPTHVSRKARLTLAVSDATAAREGLRIESSGTAAMIGLYGVSAVARQTVAAAASDLATVITLANDLRSKLITLGALQ